MKNYTAFCWNGAIGSLLSNIQPMVWVDCDNDPVQSGVNAAKALKSINSGDRVVLLDHTESLIWDADFLPGTSIQCPWLVNGAAAAALWMGQFCTAVKNNGASIDFVATDDESGLSMWGLAQDSINAIAADPRFASTASKFVLPDVTQVENLADYAEGETWGAAMESIIAGYFQEGFYLPLKQTFHNANLSNWQNYIIPEAADFNNRDLNGWPWWSTSLYGSYNAPVFYANVGQLATRNDGSGADFTQPMPVLCWMTTMARAVRAGSQNFSLPWFAFQSWPSPLANTPIWTELVYHVLMGTNAKSCLYWNPPEQGCTAPDMVAMNNALLDFKVQIGNDAFKSATTSAVPFNSTTLTSTITIGKKRISRITDATGGKWEIIP